MTGHQPARGGRCPGAPLLAACIVLAGCGGPAPAGRPVPQRHVVEMRGVAFHPATLDVAPGDTVVWINRDIVPHTATTGGGTGWDTGVLGQGDSARYVPGQGGETAYRCTLHPTMRGTVTVTR